MHAVFVLYGIKQSVDHLLMDMQAQKHQWKMTKDGKEKIIWIQGSLRLLPGGVYDYVFPKEDMDVVLSTLNFDKPPAYSGLVGKSKLTMARKMLGLKPIPNFDTTNTLLWIKNDVSIIPLGIKEDVDMTEAKGDFTGWRHEML